MTWPNVIWLFAIQISTGAFLDMAGYVWFRSAHETGVCGLTTMFMLICTLNLLVKKES